MSSWEGVRALIANLGDGGEVTAATTSAAQKYALFFEALGAESPLIFWHGGDAIVFHWPTHMYTIFSGDGKAGEILPLEGVYATWGLPIDTPAEQA